MIYSANMPSMVEPEPLASVGQTKPCGCGRTGCVAIRREREDSADWRDRKYRSRSCGTWHKNNTDPRMQEARSKGGLASTGNRRDGTNVERGALVTHPEWLDRPSGRIAAQRAAHGVVVP